MTQHQAEKFAKWSEAILSQVPANRIDAWAMDSVPSEGTYSQLASDLYDELRAKAGLV